MRKKVLIIGGAMLLLVLIVSMASADCNVGCIEGVWGEIDVYDEVPVRLDVVGVIGQNPPSGYWDGGGNLRTRDRTLVRQASVCNGTPAGSATLAGWSGHPNATYTFLGSHTIDPNCVTTDLFISEYIETSAEVRALEIFNGTSKAIDISDYAIRIYANGSTTATQEIWLSNAFLAPGDVWVVGNQATIGVPVNQNTTLSFDGNDAVALERGRTYRDDAECSRWASGGRSTNYWSNSWWNQTNWLGPNPPATELRGDENLVMYGRMTYLSGGTWQQITCANTTMDGAGTPSGGQSGFGFTGKTNVGTIPAKQPFYLGLFTHYNNPVFAWAFNNQSDSNTFNKVKLYTSVPITCSDDNVHQFEFAVLFHLEETPNTAGTCEYGSPGDEPCPDKVWVTQPGMGADTFTCPEGDYTINLLGFTTHGLGNDHCSESFNPAAVATEFITQEFQQNSACLWAEIDSPLADIAVAKTCHGFDQLGTEFYRVITTNAGPGASIGAEILDTLPTGANYDTNRTWTSILRKNGVDIPQGTCTVSGKTVYCQLLTSLPDQVSDPTARWTVEIPVTLTAGSYINTVTASAATADPNLANNTATAACESTSADLISFSGTRLPEGVQLSWAVDSAEEALTFNLYRSETTLLPTTPIATMMNEYDYLDTGAQSGVSYFYWLAIQEPSDRISLYGPFEVRAPLPFFKNFLPVFNME